MYSKETIEVLTNTAVIATTVVATGGIIGWLLVRYFKRQTDDIQNLYDLHKALPCSKHGEKITANTTDIEWLKGDGK